MVINIYSLILYYVDEAIANGQTYLLTKEELNNDADIHSMRAARAKDVYEFICHDLELHPEHYEKYEAVITAYFRRAGRTLKEDLSKSYKCRGENRKNLMDQGKETVYNRCAAMFVSCFVTNHFRTNVTITHYLIK